MGRLKNLDLSGLTRHAVVVEGNDDRDTFLVCTTCNVSLCDIEPGDFFDTIAGVVTDHITGVYAGEPMPSEREETE